MLASRRVAIHLSGNVRPDMFLYPRLSSCRRSSGLRGERPERVAFERKQHVDVAVNDFETGDVTDGAFESRVLIAADDERVKVFRSIAARMFW